MKTLTRIMLMAGICLLLPHVAMAICSTEDRIDMAQMGMSTAQIDAQCNSGINFYAPPPGFQPSATLCVTAYGACAMATQIPVGSYCECFGPYGRLPGVAR
jgi:hypothetical protein